MYSYLYTCVCCTCVFMYVLVCVCAHVPRWNTSTPSLARQRANAASPCSTRRPCRSAAPTPLQMAHTTGPFACATHTCGSVSNDVLHSSGAKNRGTQNSTPQTPLECVIFTHVAIHDMRWLWLLGSIKLQVSFSKETYKRDAILQKRPIILSILLTVATPYQLNIHDSKTPCI